MTRSTRPLLCLVALALTVPVTVAATTPVAAATATTPSAAQMLSTAVSTADAKGSMTFTDRTTSGKNVDSLTGALSAAAAAESLSETGQPPLEVVLVGNTAYVRAGAGVLQTTLGLPAAVSTANAGKWISVESGDSAFSQLTGGLTLASEFNTYVPTADLQKGKVTNLGTQKVIAISGRPSSSVTQGASSGAVALIVSTKAPYLPIGGTLFLTRKGVPNLKEVATFTGWGNKVAVTAPSGAVPFSSLVPG